MKRLSKFNQSWTQQDTPRVSEPSYVVQCTMGNPKCEYFVDCSEPLRRELADKRAADLLDPSHWCNGIVGKVRIVPTADSRCYESYKRNGLCS